MKKASPMTFLSRKAKRMEEQPPKPQNLDLNIFVVTFNDMKQSEKKITEGDPYSCDKCKAILNKFSVIKTKKQVQEAGNKFQLEMKPNQSLWQCQFCGYPNLIMIDKEEIPTKEDMFYLIESELQNHGSENQSTMVFCIDTSGSMNTTSEVAGKMDLKFGLSQEELEMLRAFMEPGDEAQFNFVKDKTFISRKQCIFSAIQSQLAEIKKSDPLKRVGFVTFNNEVTVIGDDHAATVNILGDKLNNKQSIVDSLNGFKLTQPLVESHNTLLGQLNKQEAKGQTALGPGIVSAIQIASKGSPGSTVILCTDGLANIGIGQLDPLTQEKKLFYAELAQFAKSKNISVNIMSIKGEGCKVQVIGRLAEATNGNIKVVNPEKLADDFANVLKDEIVGLNVDVIVKLHRAMVFRNEDKQYLVDNGSVLKRDYANATVNTKISFEYELRDDEDLKFMEIDIDKIKKVPFQTQILYTSPKGGKYLRVLSSESKTTVDRKEMEKQANIGVVSQRVTSLTANMYSKGDVHGSMQQNAMWSDYVMNNFNEERHRSKQQAFSTKNARLQKAMNHKIQKIERQQARQKPQPPVPRKKMANKNMEMEIEAPKCLEKKECDMSEIAEMEEEAEEKMNRSLVDSDEDEMELMDNLMEKQGFDLQEEQ